VLRDPASGDRLNEITVVDLRIAPPDDVRTYTLEAPVTVPSPGGGVSVATVLFADAMEITADDAFVVYDALNSLRLASGGTVEVWSIYALELASGGIATIVPPRAGLDVGYPALAQRSDNFLVFDAVDIATGAGSVLATNLDTGAVATVASGLESFAVPGYTGDDTRVVYSDADPGSDTGFSLVAQTVAGRLAPQGAPVPWIDDADYSTVYRRGRFVPEPAAGAGAAAAAAFAALALRRRRARGRAAP
jgi:hypothetical protein